MMYAEGKILFSLAIVSCCVILGSFTAECAQSDVNDQARILELQEANAALQSELKTLQAENQKREADLTALRSEYTQLLINGDKAIEQLAQLELSAGHLLRESISADGKDANEAVAMLATLALCRRKLLEAKECIEQYDAAVVSVLEACNASDASRQLVRRKMNEAQDALNGCLQPLALTSGNNTATTSDATVLRVDSAAKIAIIDCGYLNGIRNDDRFELRNAEGVTATLQVVECRLLKSAVQLISGNFERITPGIMISRTQTLSAE